MPFVPKKFTRLYIVRNYKQLFSNCFSTILRFNEEYFPAFFNQKDLCSSLLLLFQDEIQLTERTHLTKGLFSFYSVCYHFSTRFCTLKLIPDPIYHPFKNFCRRISAECKIFVSFWVCSQVRGHI